jgi:hypothetical protein
MKLRLQGNSIRLRLLRSEVASFLEARRIEETVHFAADGEASLTYALEHEPDLARPEVRTTPSRIGVVLPTAQAASWVTTDEVGIYASVGLGSYGSLEIVVEKDFACLDKTDAENQDTFPNPHVGAVC